MSATGLKNLLEALLFAAAKPLTAKELALTARHPVSAVTAALKELRSEYRERGVRLIEKDSTYELVSAPEFAEPIMRLHNAELRGELSKASLEVLAIIAYRQPITRLEIEEIRGVQSGETLRQLSLRGLIEEGGRKETPGRPILYKLTMEFLKHFGLESEDELPPLESFHATRLSLEE